MRKDIHYNFWLLMVPCYCEKWLEGTCYEELIKEYKLNTNKEG